MNKIVLAILDGFGYSTIKDFNATTEASFFWELYKSNPHTLLKAHGGAVGLPEEQMGNSEVGHLTIGSGRIIKQSLPFINDMISSGKFEKDQTFNEFADSHKDKTIHITGLFSSGGVHSHISHFIAVTKFLKNRKNKVKLHIILDGRDVGYRDGLIDLQNAIHKSEIAPADIATIQGRFFAMDRDKRWDRTIQAWNNIKNGTSEHKFSDPIDAISKMYEEGNSDENMPPLTRIGYEGANSGDAFFIINFRPDRIKQIISVMLDSKFGVCTMTNVDHALDKKLKIIFQKQIMHNTLGEILSKNNVKQLRIAETEKYAHVTYFFNGGNDIEYSGEERTLIPSPKVSDYLETPDMGAEEITKEICKQITLDKYQVIILNYANADMLGHTGNENAVRKSIRSLDKHLQTLLETCKSNNFDVILTADHGNAENMKDGCKTHSCSPVPFVFVQANTKEPHYTISHHQNQSLQDIAPTVLSLLNIGIPSEMTGVPLLK